MKNDGFDLAEEALPGTKNEILSGAIKPTAKFVSDLVKAEVPEDRRQIIEDYREGRSQTDIHRDEFIADIEDTDAKEAEEEAEKIETLTETAVTNVSIRQIEALAKTMEFRDIWGEYQKSKWRL